MQNSLPSVWGGWELASHHRFVGIAFTILVVFLPVGIYYNHVPSPGPELSPLQVRISFVFPITIEISREVYSISVSSGLGIFLPFFLAGHSYLCYLGTRIAKQEADFSRIVYGLVFVTILSLFAFFPTFQSNWGNIPLPLALIVGLPLARTGTPPPIADPFE
jgi:hypothetical protein